MVAQNPRLGPLEKVGSDAETEKFKLMKSGKGDD
jgi:hypothetical protein